jgi:hypothetical protein
MKPCIHCGYKTVGAVAAIMRHRDPKFTKDYTFEICAKHLSQVKKNYSGSMEYIIESVNRDLTQPVPRPMDTDEASALTLFSSRIREGGEQWEISSVDNAHDEGLSKDVRGSIDTVNKRAYLPVANNALARTIRLHEAAHAIYSAKKPQIATNEFHKQAVKDCFVHLDYLKDVNSVNGGNFSAHRDELVSALSNIRASAKFAKLNKLGMMTPENRAVMVTSLLRSASIVRKGASDRVRKALAKSISDIDSSETRFNRILDAVEAGDEELAWKLAAYEIGNPASKDKVKQPQPQAGQGKGKGHGEAKSGKGKAGDNQSDGQGKKDSSASNDGKQGNGEKDGQNKSNDKGDAPKNPKPHDGEPMKGKAGHGAAGMGKGNKQAGEAAGDADPNEDNSRSDDWDASEGMEDKPQPQHEPKEWERDYDDAGDSDEEDVDSTPEPEPQPKADPKELSAELPTLNPEMVKQAVTKMQAIRDVQLDKREKVEMSKAVNTDKEDIRVDVVDSESESEHNGAAGAEIAKLYGRYQKLPKLYVHILNPDVPRKVSCKGNAMRRPSMYGLKLRTNKLALAAVNPTGDTRIFEKKNMGGTVMIDASGSMCLDDKVLYDFAMDVPMGTVCYYSGGAMPEDGNVPPEGVGHLVVYAHKGKVRRDTGNELPFRGGDNLVDYNVLLWLLKQPKPRYFVTDRGWTAADWINKRLNIRLAQLEQAKQVIVCRDLDALKKAIKKAQRGK